MSKNNGDIWDEYMWEDHMNKMEKKRENFLKFIHENPDSGLPRWLKLLHENNDEPDAVDAFIEEELETEDMFFDDEFDDDEPGEWMGEDGFFLDDPEDEFWDDELDDFDEGEDWKMLSSEFTFSDNGSIDNLKIYNRGYDLAVNTLKWAEKIHDIHQSKALSEYVSNTLVISAKLAGGYSFGFEKDFIGGNIACTKKALHAANAALYLLKNELKREPYITLREYKYFHGELFELRNDIGIYVQELRERFNLGLE